MTTVTTKGLKELGRITPKPFNKVYEEQARVSKKITDEAKRVRRKAGIRSPQEPELLQTESTTPDPLPTREEILISNYKKSPGRSSTMLSNRLNRRRNILDFSNAGKTILK